MLEPYGKIISPKKTIYFREELFKAHLSESFKLHAWLGCWEPPVAMLIP